MAWPPGWAVTASHSEPLQSAQDRGVQQEGANVVGLTLQHLLGQVVDDVAVVPGESRDEASDVVRPCIESAASWSAVIQPFGPPVEGGDLLGRQVEPHHLIEVLRCLVGREAQIGGADLDQLAPSSQPRHRQRRVGSAGEHEVQLRRAGAPAGRPSRPGCSRASMRW